MKINNIDTVAQEVFPHLRVAIVQHWLVTRGGAERVVDAIARIFPKADIVSPIIDYKELSPTIRNRRIRTSFLQRLPGIQRYYRQTLPLHPLAIEGIDMSDYDLVVTSDAGPAKGILTSPKCVHICYCHSPMRYIWDMYHQYASAMSPMTRAIFSLVSHYMRGWDYAAAARVDHFVSNSRFVAARIRKFYRRRSTVIYPPVDVQNAWISDRQQDYYLSVGRLVGYKRVDLTVKACSQLGRRLRVIGDGPAYKELKRLAGPTVSFLGNVSDDEVRQNYAECRALIFPCEEDFGIVPVEANAFGRPVIAYAAGGALESIVGLDSSRNSEEGPHPTGVFLREQTVSSLISSILNFESRADEFRPREIRDHAMQFDTSVFLDRFAKFTLQALTSASVATPFDTNENGSTTEEEYGRKNYLLCPNTQHVWNQRCDGVL